MGLLMMLLLLVLWLPGCSPLCEAHTSSSGKTSGATGPARKPVSCAPALSGRKPCAHAACEVMARFNCTVSRFRSHPCRNSIIGVHRSHSSADSLHRSVVVTVVPEQSEMRKVNASRRKEYTGRGPCMRSAASRRVFVLSSHSSRAVPAHPTMPCRYWVNLGCGGRRSL